ncbi:Polygalacturonase, family GH28 [Zostera marina]|uniref:Exopolygalacturonase n=2 Tax=Zostera marina TaxID=29655 RepID=A0A0K9P4V1_ZOSMR|nr:Polygalacturonase, family GH28 [Zostera marina]
MAKYALLSILLPMFYFTIGTIADYNIMDLGAKSHSTNALLQAWSLACASSNGATIYIPKGRFSIGHVKFQGPCKNTNIIIQIDGTLVAPSNYKGAGDDWIVFYQVDGVSIQGGTLDGQGAALWKCKESNKNCPTGWKNLLFDNSKNIVVNGLTSKNSKQFHIVIRSSERAMLKGVTVIAPGDSPNTDGISVQGSSDVTIRNANIKTGDDCISISEGARNVWAEHIACGPGHGISIGSIGKTYSEKGVENVTVKNTVFTGSENGLRIKTWGRPSTAFVRGVIFQESIMKNVKNPIIINQDYCPHSKNCPNQNSGVKVSDITYDDIQGSSASSVAVKFDCSKSNPCNGILTKNIKLTYHGGKAKSSCKYAKGSISGFVDPQSCITK